MTSKQVKDRGGNTINVVEIEGRLYPGFPLESLHNVPHFKARHDDILLCTYPKSGTHWTYEIIRFVIAGTTDLPVVEKGGYTLEYIAPSSEEDLPSPRFLNTHFHFEALSPDFLRQKSKIIYLSRDPRDVAVSYFNHHTKFSEYGYTGEWKDYLHLYLEGQVDYDSWFDYTKRWEEGMKEYPDHPFLALSYEAMKHDALGEIQRLAHFLGLERSEDFLKQVVEKSSFDVMKSSRATVKDADSSIMYRKGQVGDWKNWFTVAQSELFNEVFEKAMPGTNAYKLYSHTVQG